MFFQGGSMTIEVIEAIITLLSGLGILLVGFKMLSDNIERLANVGLKKLFSKTSKNIPAGIGIGAFYEGCFIFF